jgi:hypothetical protein
MRGSCKAIEILEVVTGHLWLSSADASDASKRVVDVQMMSSFPLSYSQASVFYSYRLVEVVATSLSLLSNRLAIIRRTPYSMAAAGVRLLADPQNREFCFGTPEEPTRSLINVRVERISCKSCRSKPLVPKVAQFSHYIGPELEVALFARWSRRAVGHSRGATRRLRGTVGYF